MYGNTEYMYAPEFGLEALGTAATHGSTDAALHRPNGGGVSSGRVSFFLFRDRRKMEEYEVEEETIISENEIPELLTELA